MKQSELLHAVLVLLLGMNVIKTSETKSTMITQVRRANAVFVCGKPETDPQGRMGHVVQSGTTSENTDALKGNL